MFSWERFDSSIFVCTPQGGSKLMFMPFEIVRICVWLWYFFHIMFYCSLSYDVASGSEITPCNKIDKPLVVYRFTGNVMTSITTLRT